MKDTKELKEIIESRLKQGISIGIMSHIDPDGDGFCASLALQELLRTKGLDSEIIIDGGSLKRFSYLMEGAVLHQYHEAVQYDLLIVLDCNSYSRLGERAALVGKAGWSVVIDHHVPENGIIEADYCFVDISAVSVGAIIFETFKDDISSLPDKNRVYIANNIYTTILNDTNNFTNANTNAEVFRICSGIAACGISPSRLYRLFFLNHEPLEMRYIGEVLSTIELLHSDQILYMLSTARMQTNNELTTDSIMNITRWVQGVKGVLAIAYLREEGPGEYKISLRSPVLDVNRIAVSYGGGGHKNASGALVKGELASIKSSLLEKLCNALDEYQNDGSPARISAD
jgi:bifunctional oligoribonuclease and PAP phosphatase NrnA